MAVIEGSVSAAKAFERPIGDGLKLLLEPIASGWILRIVPAIGPRGSHDYAELANPPYLSVSPLLVGTDFSFRAQDAIAWNPRHFRFAADRPGFNRLSTMYEELQRRLPVKSGNVASVVTDRALDLRLSALAGSMPEGELTLLDAHIVPGTADQARSAAMVASHLGISEHTAGQSPDGHATPLGRIDWLRFRIKLNLPATFHAAPDLRVEASGCL